MHVVVLERDAEREMPFDELAPRAPSSERRTAFGRPVVADV